MPQPTKIHGPYEATACLVETYTGKNASCTEQIQKAEQEAIRNGATCRKQVEHILYQNTGRINTLWSLICEGPVAVPAAEPRGEPVLAPAEETAP